MDTGKLRLKVEVPLKGDQTVLLRLKPKRSTGTLSGDVRKVRMEHHSAPRSSI